MDETICYSFEDFLNLFNEYSETTQEERKSKLLENRDYYHAANGLPDWFADSLDAFKTQVIDMASPTKPLKTTETFKVQAGYPHEVAETRKVEMRKYGIKQDRNVERGSFLIPKLDAQEFHTLARNENIVSFSTPKDSTFIRELVFVDNQTQSDLVIFYVVGRKARTLSSWAVKKDKDKIFTPQINKFEEWKYRQP